MMQGEIMKNGLGMSTNDLQETLKQYLLYFPLLRYLFALLNWSL